MTLPSSNLKGDYRDSCVACLRGTDTGIAFAGEPEWVAAALVRLGIPTAQAVSLISTATGCAAGEVPGHDITLTFRVCAACASASGTGMQVGLVATGVPSYGPKR